MSGCCGGGEEIAVVPWKCWIRVESTMAFTIPLIVSLTNAAYISLLPNATAAALKSQPLDGSIGGPHSSWRGLWLHLLDMGLPSGEE